MKKILVIIVVILSLCGCGTNKGDSSNTSSLDTIIAENNYVIVDVRTSAEYSEGHLVGAINIPYDEIDENTNLDKTKTILVYCRSGNRSSTAYNTLKALGYDVYDMGAFAKIDLPKE